MSTIPVNKMLKRVGMTRRHNFDFVKFAEIAEDGETIVSATVVLVSGDDVLVMGLTGFAGSKVQIVLAAGTVGDTYRLRATITTSGGAILPLDGDLEIVS